MNETENVNFNPFDLFISESTDVDVEVRINSMKKLTTVAVALDTERTVNELFPYLNSLTDGILNDDEVLLNLAEQLEHFLPLVGGTENAFLILNVLEKLASIEENVVREKAVETLNSLANSLDATILETIFVPLVLRLANSDWFTSKSSGCALFAVCYPSVSENVKSELRKEYRILCQDDSPLVRRSAAAQLVDLVKVLELQYLKDEFIPVFDNFAKDDQDSVRVLAVDVGISIVSYLKMKEVEDFILTTIIELSADASWRVRYEMVNQINTMQVAFGYEMTRKHLVLIYQNLVHDTEPQVREAAATEIVRFCEILQETFIENEKDTNDTIDPTILNAILPLIQYLDQDINSDVKEALSSVITRLGPLLGIESTKNFLLPLVTSSLLNDSSKVKENIIANLNNIIAVIGISDIADTVQKIMADLVNNSASIWRTRRNLIVTINYIGNQSGKEYFDEHLKSLYKKLLSDGVYAVRKTAPLILPILAKNFGIKWAMDSIVPEFLDFSEHSHYLYRYVCLFCIDELVAPILEHKTAEENRLKYLEQVRSISNTDLKNDVATFVNKIRNLNLRLKVQLEEQWVADCLMNLQEHEIPNDDIKRYAEDTIEMFIKDNNLQIRQVEKSELDKNDVYLEGVLDLIVNKFLTVLQNLSKDSVPNVQLKVGQTLKHIKNFNEELQAELDENWVHSLTKDVVVDEFVDTEPETVQETQVVEEMNIDTVEERTLENEIIELLEEKLAQDSLA